MKIGALTGSAILYLAVEGGFDIAPVMGSQSTLTRGAIGGFEGRALRAGDVLPLRQPAAAEREEVMLPPLDLAPPPRIRVVLGPQDDHFTPAGLRTLLESTYTISRASDRMGMRLEGPTLEHSGKGANIISDGIAPGSIQVPGNGLPIVLLADRQTTGGYPKVATVISADMPALGRMTPGSKIAFAAVDIEAAEAAARQLAADIAALPGRIVPVRRAPAIDPTKLMGENLISGTVDAREGGRAAPESRRPCAAEHRAYRRRGTVRQRATGQMPADESGRTRTRPGSIVTRLPRIRSPSSPSLAAAMVARVATARSPRARLTTPCVWCPSRTTSSPKSLSAVIRKRPSR